MTPLTPERRAELTGDIQRANDSDEDRAAVCPAGLMQNEKRVKIAEACIPGLTAPYGCFNAPELSGRVNGEEWILLDYFGSLDAMHEAEKVLTPMQAQRYFREIRSIYGDPEPGREVTISDFYLHATAAQRAEAFGKTLKLW